MKTATAPSAQDSLYPDVALHARWLALRIQLRARRDASYEHAPGRVAAIRVNGRQA